MAESSPNAQPVADPSLNQEIKKSSEALKKQKTLHLMLMILGWASISLGVIILLSSILLSFVLSVQYSVSPCADDCFNTFIPAVVTSFVTFGAALGQFWAADKLEADKYSETGMWISMLLLIPFLGFFVYIVIHRTVGS